MGKKDIVALVRECGCSVKKDGDDYSISLRKIRIN